MRMPSVAVFDDVIRPAESEPASNACSVRILPTTHIPDAELVIRAQEGDRWAEEMLYRRYVQPLTRMVQRLLRSSHDAEDVVQESFAAGFEQIQKIREPAAFRGWLFQIAVYTVRRRFRKQKILRFLGLNTDHYDCSLETAANDCVSPEVRAELQKIDRLLLCMPDELRIAWMLRYVEGETVDVVATAMGCSLATAKRRIRAASDRIQSHIIQQEDDR